MVLYRTYRPQSFSQLIGQDAIKQALTAAIQKNTVGHAYLFCGPRGCGKTSTARILAKALNCENVHSSQSTLNSKKQSVNSEPSTVNLSSDPCNACASCQAITEGNHMDVIEIDAASNRGIDDVRQLQERINLSPVMGKKKVYIIDEVHMLTTEAFNALLKTLEEPPAHAVLILATTEVHKLPQTIVSRCLRFDFNLASDEDLKLVLQPIITQENITIDDDAMQLLIQRAEGGFRDAIKLLDQVSATEQAITKEVVGSLFKTPQHHTVVQFLEYVFAKDEQQALTLVATMHEQGENAGEFVITCLRMLRELLLAKSHISIMGSKAAPAIDEAKSTLAKAVSKFDLVQVLKLFSQAQREMKQSAMPFIPLEVAVVEWCLNPNESNVSTVVPKSTPEPVKEASKQPEPEVETVESKREQVTAVKEGKPIIPPEEVGAMLAESSDNIEVAKVEIVPEAVIVPLTNTAVETPKKHHDTAVTISTIQEKWPLFLQHVMEHNHSIALLIKNSQIYSFDGQTLTLEAYYKFHKERLENDKIRKLVETSFEQVTGTPVLIRCVLSQKTKKAAESEEIGDVAAQIFGADAIE